MNYELPKLLYSYKEFEPYIDAKTMEVHYSKHHQAYMNNTNNILKSINIPFMSINKLITSLNIIPLKYRNILRNNAGGYFNHNLFWKGLKLNTKLNGVLKEYILNKFGTFEIFINEFNEKAMNLFGSGWIWLIIENKNLSIVLTSNQDNPLMGREILNITGYPIICLDLWEHAYYLQYQNRRIEYVKSFWNIVNWDEASFRFNYYMNNIQNIDNNKNC